MISFTESQNFPNKIEYFEDMQLIKGIKQAMCLLKTGELLYL